MYCLKVVNKNINITYQQTYLSAFGGDTTMKFLKRGQIGFNNLTGIALAIMSALLFIGIFAFALTTVADNTTSNEIDLTVGNATLFGTNVASQMPVVGTLVGIAILLTVVLGAFAFSRSRR